MKMACVYFLTVDSKKHLAFSPHDIPDLEIAVNEFINFYPYRSELFVLCFIVRSYHFWKSPHCSLLLQTFR